MARESDFNWEDDLMTKSYQRQESHLARLAKSHGANYGKPKPGSESEKRSIAYQKEVIKECVYMCQMVAQFGTRLPDGTEQIQFGELFRLTEGLTNKCVGILQRARKHRSVIFELPRSYEIFRLVHFAGDTLWQGEDDKKLVTLIRRNREVQVYFEHTRQLLPNNPGSNSVIEIGSQRRAHFPWVNRVTEVDDDTTAYHVEVHTADFDDDQELPQRCFPLNKGEEWLKPEYSQEPKVIFAKTKAQAERPPLKHCCYEEFFWPCVPGDQEEIPPLPDTRHILAYVVQQPDRGSPPPSVALPSSPIRPLVRLFPKPAPLPKSCSPPPPPPRPQRVKLTLVLPEIPQYIPPVTPRAAPIENPKCSIKFSACTALYVPPKPSLEGYKHKTSLGETSSGQSLQSLTSNNTNRVTSSKSDPRWVIRLYFKTMMALARHSSGGFFSQHQHRAVSELSSNKSSAYSNNGRLSLSEVSSSSGRSNFVKTSKPRRVSLYT